MVSMRFDGVQVLRGLAALLVLIAHAPFVLPPAAWPETPSFGGGAIGVDLFFVISGFVIAMTIDRHRPSAAEFLRDRSTRVLPLYLLASAPFLLFGSPLAIVVWNTIFLVPVFDVGTYTNPAHWFGWSVVLELWFYALFAIAVRMGAGARVFSLLLLAFVALGVALPGEWVLPKFLGTMMGGEFLLGVWLYRFRGRLTPMVGGAFLVLGGALAVYGVAVGTDLPLHGPVLVDWALGLKRLVLWGLPCGLIVGGVVGLNGVVRCAKPLVWFGDISYSFYLVQPFAILALQLVVWPAW